MPAWLRHELQGWEETHLLWGLAWELVWGLDRLQISPQIVLLPLCGTLEWPLLHVEHNRLQVLGCLITAARAAKTNVCTNTY